MNPLSKWMSNFDPRQQKQINWSLAYDQDEFRHGDNGYNDKIIIAKMARLLDELEAKVANNADA